MSAGPVLRRRGFLGLSAALAGGAALAPAMAAGQGLPGATLVLHDARHPASRRFAASATARGAVARPVEGDRVRLIRALAGDMDRPERMVGLTRYADYLLLTGAAEEAGYRIVGHALHGCAAQARHRCQGVLAPAASLLTASGDQWPEALAAAMLDGASPVPHGREALAEGGSLLSWVAVARNG